MARIQAVKYQLETLAKKVGSAEKRTLTTERLSAGISLTLALVSGAVLWSLLQLVKGHIHTATRMDKQRV